MQLGDCASEDNISGGRVQASHTGLRQQPAERISHALSALAGSDAILAALVSNRGEYLSVPKRSQGRSLQRSSSGKLSTHRPRGLPSRAQCLETS